MRACFLFLPLLLLTSCTLLQIKNGVSVSTSDKVLDERSIRDALNNQSIEQVPAELSIDHFSKMLLVGTGLTLKDVLFEADTYTRYQISYLGNQVRISGILNIPKGIGPYPLIVLNHGYIDPKVYTVGRGLKREQDYLARHGYAVLHTDYRGHGLSDKSPDTREIYDAGLEYSMDSINAIHAVRNSSDDRLRSIDTQRVGMLGHSLGGGVTLNILTGHPEMINAAVLYAPVSGDAWKNFVRWRKERPEGDKTIAELGEWDENNIPWAELSSLKYINRIDDPVLIFHGTADTDVPIEWSYELEEALKENHRDFTLIVYGEEKHEFVPKWQDFMQRTVEFFDRNLKTKAVAE